MEAINIIQITVPELKSLFASTLKEVLANQQEDVKTEKDKWFDLKELAEYIPGKHSQSTIYRWHSQGTIPSHKKGKKIFFKKSEIDTWLLSGKNKPRSDIDAAADASIIRRIPQKTQHGGRA